MNQWNPLEPVLWTVSAIVGIAVYTFPNIYTVVSFLVLLFLTFKILPQRKSVIAICIVPLFILLSYLHETGNQTNFKEGNFTITVRFIDLYRLDGNALNMVVSSKEERLLLLHTFKSKKELRDFEQKFSLASTCKMEVSFILPNEARNPNSFNYRQYLKRQNIHWIIKPNNKLIESCQGDKKTPLEIVKMMRKSFIDKIKEKTAGEVRGFAIAMLFGDTDYLDIQTYSEYQKLGLVHLIAISGLNIVLLVSAIYLLGIRAGITRQSMRGLILILLPVYCILAGASPSVIRACIMVGLFMLLTFFRFKISPTTILSIVSIAVLAHTPTMLFDIGFQLSFGITFALLFSKKILSRNYGKYTFIKQSFNISIISQLISTPIILFHFSEITLIGIFLNIVYVPVFSFVILPGSILLFLSIILIPFIMPAIQWLLEMVLGICNNFGHWVSLFPLSSFVLGKVGFPFIILFMMAVLCLFISWEKIQLQQIILSSSLVFLLAMGQFFINERSLNGEIVFIDIGQGDSILIQQPLGRGTTLIDTGGILRYERDKWEKRKKSFDPGKDIVIPLLKSKGIREIDRLILTHPDQDHIGGAKGILESIRVKEIIIAEHSIDEFKQIPFIVDEVENGRRISFVKRGDQISIGNNDILHVLGPNEDHEDKNEESIVLAGRIGGLEWMFTGDLGKSGEEEILFSYPKIKVDVLKVGHHGSKNSTSENFLKRLNPRFAIISAGKKNRYGHPHKEVINHIVSEGITLYRTDISGAITYSFRVGGKEGTFSTQLHTIK
ncbi:DNA internalization-related competence protein ComEC/Rec2 [Peribacillus acanthi]|uniref:DNA internalization-related competence protein ComEC/Rec2 n=1 Tax=Peribacillus acanthi TaxID=2171554 RepID=UPI000D3EA6DB|nr:DNA internalization-related competence protein ComEC/Rec2 [Peribacillus acanthi]